MDSAYLQIAAEDHFDERGEWAISVASIPGKNAEEIAAASPIVRRYRRMRVGRAGAFKAAGFIVEADEEPHALVVLPGEPDDRTWNELRSLMEERDNPYYGR
jgi:hypothetical protein